METFKYYGHQPILRQSRHMWVPNTETYTGNAIWQDLPRPDEPVNEDGVHPADEVMSLLQSLREQDDVVDVWHNIRGVAPWDDVDLSKEDSTD
jgi:hypothetical protein